MAGIVSGPGQLDWEVYAGDLNRETFEFLTSDDPWDITGCTLMAQARKSATDAVIALTATTAITDAGNGLATVEWNGDAVRTLLAGKDSWVGVWDLQILEQGETFPRTMVRGAFRATLDVTRPGA